MNYKKSSHLTVASHHQTTRLVILYYHKLLKYANLCKSQGLLQLIDFSIPIVHNELENNMNQKGGGQLIIISIIVSFIVLGLGKHYLEGGKISKYDSQYDADFLNIFQKSQSEKNNFIEDDSSVPVIKIMEPCNDLLSTTDSVWKSGSLKYVKVNFSYPGEWGIDFIDNPRSSDGYPPYGNIQLCKNILDSENKEVFRFNAVFGADGVGGGCPEFNHDKDVVAKKDLIFFGKKRYLVFYGDKEKDVIKNAAVAENAESFCPNVAVFNIDGIQGISAAGFYFEDINESFKPINSQEFLNSQQVKDSIKVLESLKLAN